MFRMMLLVTFGMPCILGPGAQAAALSHDIKLDNLGYRPADSKIAAFSANPGATVEVRDTTDAVVLTVPTDGGSITSMGYDGDPSGDTVWWVDFSPLTTPGVYRLFSGALSSQSYDFEVREDIYGDVMRTALKTFFYQRCNTAKGAAHAGPWTDAAACH